jgi:hypothetical protein
MVNDQIVGTIELIVKLESQLANELIDLAEPRLRRRSLGQANPRSRSQFEQIRLDQTLMTELEYLNILPDMSRFQDINEASFLKSMPN